MQAEPNEHVAATALFSFLAGTLGDMADRVARLEEHAESMISDSPRRQELLIVLQDFDLIRQTMEDCARLCTAASLQDDGMRRSLAGTMRLEALRDRLLHDPAAGAGRRSASGSETDAGGELFLFDGAEVDAGDVRDNVPEVVQIAGRQ
jgi:hypothetical protein